MAKSEQELLDAYKKRIKQQNKNTKEKYDKITATLPKGTIERIRAQGLTISEVVNKSVLEYLERLEGLQDAQDTSTPVQETPEEIPEFHGLRAAEWKKEIHGGKVPEPPTGTIMDEAAGEYLFYDGYVKQWYLGFDDE